MSNFELEFAGARFRLNREGATSIAIPVDFENEQPNAFGLPRASSEPFTLGDFVADVREGSPINCFTVTLNPHGSGTHTECVGHILKERVSISTQLDSPLIIARLVTVSPARLDATGEAYLGPSQGDDQVLSRAALEATLSQPVADALIVRRSEPRQLRCAEYSGNNPPYFTTDAMRFVREQGYRHILTDLPSVDREQDDGVLACHHIFWGVPIGRNTLDSTPPARTITEMIDVPRHLPDGVYAMTLGVPAFMLDAAPSNPVLFPLIPLP